MDRGICQMQDVDQAGPVGLFETLCKLHLKGGYARAYLIQPKYSRREKQRKVKQTLYNTLFQHLKGRYSQSSVRETCEHLNEVDQVYCVAFSWRMQRRFDEANRLETLADNLKKVGVESEMLAVLHLLLQLSATGSQQQQPKFIIGQPPSHHIMHDQKAVLPHGPPVYGDTTLVDSSNRGYLIYPKYVCRSLVTPQGCIQLLANRENVWAITIEVFRASIPPANSAMGYSIPDSKIFTRLPGSGLRSGSIFSSTESVKEDYIHGLRSTLFGALSHSCRSNFNVKLDVPDLANDKAPDLSIPKTASITEDEGFVDNLSSSTSSSQLLASESPPTHEPDPTEIWETCLQTDRFYYRAWEIFGRLPFKTERPYLTEGSRNTADHAYCLYYTLLTFIDPSLSLPILPTVQLGQLMRDLRFCLIGVPSDLFSCDELTNEFHIKVGTYISGMSPESVEEACRSLTECGTLFLNLKHFSRSVIRDSFYHHGLIFQAFTSAVKKFLQYYIGAVLSFSSELTLLELCRHLRKLIAQVRCVAKLCRCFPKTTNASTDAEEEDFPTGVRLLTLLYEQALDAAGSQLYPLMLSFLCTSCGPYIMFVQDWVFHGHCTDVYGEFMIKVNKNYLNFRDKHYWTHGYMRAATNPAGSVPSFLLTLADDIFVCGKSVNLLKCCAPQHFLLNVTAEIPQVNITFTESTLNDLEQRCETYISHMTQVAKQITLSREKHLQRAEQAKQELIVNARRTAAHHVQQLQSKYNAQKQKEKMRKLAVLNQLQDQMHQNTERRDNKRKVELEKDRQLVAEATLTEVMSTKLDKRLEQEAREDLVEYYSKLTADAALREQKALWLARRRQLTAQRLTFLQAEEDQLRLELEQHSMPPAEPVSTAQAQEEGDQKLSQAAFPLESAADAIENSEVSEKLTNKSHPSYSTVGEDLRDEHLKHPNDERYKDYAPVTFVKEVAKVPVSVDTVGDLMYPGQPLEQRHAANLAASSPVTCGSTEGPGVGAVKAAGDGDHTSDTALDTKPERAVTDEREQQSEDGVLVSLEKVGEAQTERSLQEVEIPTLTEEDARVLIPKPNIKTVGGRHASVESADDVVDSHRPCVRVGAAAVHQQTADSGESEKPHIRLHGSQSASQESEASSQPKPHICISDKMSASTETESKLEVIKCIKPGMLHAHMESVQLPGTRHIKILEGKSSNTQSEGESVRVPTRSRYGHASERSEEELYSGVPRLKKHFGTHVSQQSDLCSYQIKPHGRRKVLDQEIDRETEAKKYCPSIKIHTKRHAAMESVPEDDTRTRLNKFHEQNVHGHSSDSSVQRLLYGGQAHLTSTEPVTDVEIMQITLECNSATQPYDEDFNITKVPPMVDLMAYRPSDPRSGLYDYDVGETDNISACGYMSLPAVLQRCITAPLQAQISLVNQSIVTHFLVELNTEYHLLAMRKFLLMQDGEFSQSLSDQLFDRLSANPEPHKMLNPLYLNNVLAVAMQACRHSDDKYAANVNFSVRYLPDQLKVTAPGALDCLQLSYKVDWPVNIVITDTSVRKYGRVFTLMLQLKRSVWVLKDIWHRLKRDSVLHHSVTGSQFRQLQLYRHEMQHFVKVMQGYLSHQILHVTWTEFQTDLSSNLSNLNDLHDRHNEYINKCLYRCLLTKKAGPVMKIVQDVFCLILRFHAQLVSQPWEHSPQGATHPAFTHMCATYRSFNEYSRFLYTVVNKLALRGFQPHLQDLILRLNFNSFYQ